jgi:Tfp pilus assembly protein PilW
LKELIRDEDGVTLVELLAGLALLSLILIPLGSVLSISAKSVKIQREQAEIQSVANLMTAQMIDISQRKNIKNQK